MNQVVFHELDGVPPFVDPLADYPDPFLSLIDRRKEAYPLIEWLLFDPVRVAFLQAYVRGITGRNDVARLDDRVDFDVVPDNCRDVIALIAECGLVYSSHKIQPDDILTLLRSPEALAWAHVSIGASNSPYWEQYEPPQERPVEPKRREGRLLAWLIQHAKPIAIAASVLVAFAAGRTSGIESTNEMRRVILKLEAQIAQLVKEHQAAQPSGLSPAEAEEASFRHDFEAGQEVKVDLDDPQTDQLKLLLNENMRPPYFDKVDVSWNFDIRKIRQLDGKLRDDNTYVPIYYWRNLSVTPEIVHRFEREPGDPPAIVQIRFRFFVSDEARKQLRLTDYVIEHTIPVLVTPTGVSPLASNVAGGIVGNILAPRAEIPPDGRFELRVAARLEAEPPPGSSEVLHVFVRALDGKGPWTGTYYIVPWRLPARQLTRNAQTITVPLSLSSMFGSPASPIEERWPHELELLLVKLPVPLSGWSIDRSRLDLNSAEAEPLILDRVTLKWSYSQSELLSDWRK